MLMTDPQQTLVTSELVPGTVIRDAALRNERVPDKDKGAKNDEHVPEGASPLPGSSEISRMATPSGPTWIFFEPRIGPVVTPISRRELMSAICASFHRRMAGARVRQPFPPPVLTGSGSTGRRARHLPLSRLAPRGWLDNRGTARVSPASL